MLSYQSLLKHKLLTQATNFATSSQSTSSFLETKSWNYLKRHLSLLDQSDKPTLALKHSCSSDTKYGTSVLPNLKIRHQLVSNKRQLFHALTSAQFDCCQTLISLNFGFGAQYHLVLKKKFGRALVPSQPVYGCRVYSCCNNLLWPWDYSFSQYSLIQSQRNLGQQDHCLWPQHFGMLYQQAAQEAQDWAHLWQNFVYVQAKNEGCPCEVQHQLLLTGRLLQCEGVQGKGSCIYWETICWGYLLPQRSYFLPSCWKLSRPRRGRQGVSWAIYSIGSERTINFEVWKSTCSQNN